MEQAGDTVSDHRRIIKIFQAVQIVISLLPMVTLFFFIPVGIVMALFMPRKHRFLPDLPTIILGIGVAGLVFVTQVDPHHWFDRWMD